MLMFGIRVRARRGIILIISLITLLLITMLVGAVFTLLPTQLAASDHEGQSVLAVAACASGGDYAQSRMQNRPTWKGDFLGTTGNFAGYVVNTQALKIYEDNGNVIGLMTQSDGTQTAFRMRFNFQNGASVTPEDNFADPAASHFISIPQVSFNNLGVDGFTNPPIYTATNVSGNFKVNSLTSSEVIPRFQSAVYIEGLSGPGLRTATINTIDALARQRDVVSQTALVRVGFLNQSRVDSAVYAGGAFSTTVNGTEVPGTNNTQLESAPDTAAAHIRTLSNSSTAWSLTNTAASKLKAVDAGSRIYYGGGSAPTNTTISSVGQNAATQDSHWLKMKWSEVPKSTPAASDSRMKAGTYYWHNNAGTPELLYYPEECPPFPAIFVPSTVPQVIPNSAALRLGGSGIDLNPATMTTTITDKVWVAPVDTTGSPYPDNSILPVNAVKGISFAIDPVYQAVLPIRPAVVLDPDPLKTCILSAPGTILVQGKVEGMGSVTTEGNLTIQGTSLFEADQTDAVVLYAKKDIRVESIPDSVAMALAPVPPAALPGMGMGQANGWGKHNKPNNFVPIPPAKQLNGDVQFAGAVFAMGNVTTNITNGGLYMRGVLSAYGGDPEDPIAANRSPGMVAGSGVIDVKASRVQFMYDPSYLMTKGNQGTPSYLDRISWNLLP